MKIKYIDWGIAYASGNVVEVNPLLKKHPRLYKLILRHEMEHIQNPSFFDTLRIDFTDMFDFKKQALISKLPLKMRLQANMPIWYHKGQLNGNLFLLVLYSLLIIIIVL